MSIFPDLPALDLELFIVSVIIESIIAAFCLWYCSVRRVVRWHFKRSWVTFWQKVFGCMDFPKNFSIYRLKCMGDFICFR